MSNNLKFGSKKKRTLIERLKRSLNKRVHFISYLGRWIKWINISINSTEYPILGMMAKKQKTKFSFEDIFLKKTIWISDWDHLAKPFKNVSFYSDLVKNYGTANFSRHELYEKYDNLVFWGIKSLIRQGKGKSEDFASKAIVAEDGFIRSILPSVAGDRASKKFWNGYSIVIDDLAPHFAGKFVTRIEQKLNSDFKLTAAELERSKLCIQKIIDNNVTKYNFQKICKIKLPGINKKKVLIIDQTSSDASIEHCNLNHDYYVKMLQDAIRENKDSDIIIKSHPSSLLSESSEIAGFFNSQNTKYPNVYLFVDTVNPIMLIKMVDKVYVGSSGVGMEAILCGKEVFCYGVPFYAGWGLTVDRNQLFIDGILSERRSKKRTKEELFYAFYIWYTNYIDPETKEVCEIENIIDLILRYRDEYLKLLEMKKWTVGFVNFRSSVFMEYQLKILYEFNQPSDFNVVIVDNTNEESESKALLEICEPYIKKYQNLQIINNKSDREELKKIYGDRFFVSGHHSQAIKKIYDIAKNTSSHLLIQDPDFFYVRKDYLNTFYKLHNKGNIAVGAPYPKGAAWGDPFYPEAYGCSYILEYLNEDSFSAGFATKEEMEIYNREYEGKYKWWGFDVGWRIRKDHSDKPFISFDQRICRELVEKVGRQFSVKPYEYSLNGHIIGYHLNGGTRHPKETEEYSKKYDELELEKIFNEWQHVRKNYSIYFYNIISSQQN